MRMQVAGEHRFLALGDAMRHQHGLRPVAVEPSYIEEFATSMPASNATCVWNSNK